METETLQRAYQAVDVQVDPEVAADVRPGQEERRPLGQERSRLAPRGVWDLQAELGGEGQRVAAEATVSAGQRRGHHVLRSGTYYDKKRMFG